MRNRGGKTCLVLLCFLLCSIVTAPGDPAGCQIKRLPAGDVLYLGYQTFADCERMAEATGLSMYVWQCDIWECNGEIVGCWDDEYKDCLCINVYENVPP